MINLRLKEERERLGLTQPALAEVAVAGKRTVIDWEKGVSSPTAVQLAAIASAGADVLYIVTGKRGLAVAEIETLPPDERVLIDSYRRCNADARRNLIQTAALLSAGLNEGSASAAGTQPKGRKALSGQKVKLDTSTVVQNIEGTVHGPVAGRNVRYVGPSGGPSRGTRKQ